MEISFDQSMAFNKVLPEQWHTQRLSASKGEDNESAVYIPKSYFGKETTKHKVDNSIGWHYGDCSRKLPCILQFCRYKR